MIRSPKGILPPMFVKSIKLWWMCGILFRFEYICDGFSLPSLPSAGFELHHHALLPQLHRHRRSHMSPVSLWSTSVTGTTGDAVGNSPSVEVIDPETGCHVVLLGCFHGTLSSAKDVEHVLTEQETDVVALELCATRFADLRREEQRQNDDNNDDDENVVWIQSYVRMILNTVRTRGLATGLAAAVLSGVSGLQTAISGFTPGLEFTTALEWADSQPDSSCDIVLADQDVDETLRLLGSLPQVALDTIIANPIHSIPYYSQVLKTALFGQIEEGLHALSENQQVHIGKVLTRNPDAIQDLVRLTIPPLLLMQLVSFSLSNALYSIEDAGIADELLLSSSSPLTVLYDRLSLTGSPVDGLSLLLMDLLPQVLVSGIILSLSYIVLALPAVRVILFDRDEILTNGILAACRVAASKQQHSEPDTEEGEARPGRVVAVLGLLHVNGVAQRILSKAGSHRGRESI